MDEKRAYIGDGVYASFDGYHIVLETYDGEWRDRICLDSHVARALIDYIKSIWGFGEPELVD